MVYVMEHPKENMDDLRVAPCFVKIPASGTPKSNDWKIMGTGFERQSWDALSGQTCATPLLRNLGLMNLECVEIQHCGYHEHLVGFQFNSIASKPQEVEYKLGI